MLKYTWKRKNEYVYEKKRNKKQIFTDYDYNQLCPFSRPYFLL